MDDESRDLGHLGDELIAEVERVGETQNADVSRVRDLLLMGADPCHVTMGDDGYTGQSGLFPLLVTVTFGHLEVTRLLLSGGEKTRNEIKMADNNKDDITATEVDKHVWFCDAGQVVRAEYFSSFCAPSALHEACSDGNLEITQILMSHDLGNCLHLSNKFGQTPLLLAVASGSHMVVELLLTNGACITDTDASGQGALHAAMRLSTEEAPAMIRVLLEAGADPRSRDNGGLTPARQALLHTKPHRLHVAPSTANLDYLVGISHVELAMLDVTELEMTVVHEQRDQLEQLLTTDTKRYKTLPPGGSVDCLILAAQQTQADLMSVLLMHPGFHRLLESRGTLGRTPLQAACVTRNVNAVMCLLAAGCNPNAKGYLKKTEQRAGGVTTPRDRMTSSSEQEVKQHRDPRADWPPLWLAVTTGDSDVTQLLLLHGADTWWPFSPCLTDSRPPALSSLPGWYWSEMLEDDAMWDALYPCPLRKALACGHQAVAILLIQGGAPGTLMCVEALIAGATWRVLPYLYNGGYTSLLAKLTSKLQNELATEGASNLVYRDHYREGMLNDEEATSTCDVSLTCCTSAVRWLEARARTPPRLLDVSRWCIRRHLTGRVVQTVRRSNLPMGVKQTLLLQDATWTVTS